VITPPLLRSPIHPGQADTLVHFCSRGRRSAAPDVAHLAANERLDSILGDEALRAFPPYGSSWPVVCFSERRHRWRRSHAVARRLGAVGCCRQPRLGVWQQGGGPVSYVRDEVRADIAPNLDERTLSWLVRTEPQSSDWLHEREWRVPCADASQAALRLTGGSCRHPRRRSRLGTVGGRRPRGKPDGRQCRLRRRHRSSRSCRAGCGTANASSNSRTFRPGWTTTSISELGPVAPLAATGARYRW
jgi:hypothetical protein